MTLVDSDEQTDDWLTMKNNICRFVVKVTLSIRNEMTSDRIGYKLNHVQQCLNVDSLAIACDSWTAVG